MSQQTAPQRGAGGSAIPVIYAVVSAMWLVTSDAFTEELGGSPILHTAKGFAFVLITSVMLHALIARYAASIRESERQIHESERMKAVGEQTTLVTHELRNVLHAAKAMTAVLQRHIPTSPGCANAVRHLGTAFQRAELLLSSILTFAVPRRAQTEPIALDVWLREFVEWIRHTTRDNVTVDLEQLPNDLVAHADPLQLNQLLTNLVLNANDAIPGAGHILIGASADIRAEVPGVTVTVRDDGAGMPAEIARRVFEPLFTTKRKGTGLGLAIVKRIATAHDGAITLETALGAGTTFHVFFPNAEPHESDGAMQLTA